MSRPPNHQQLSNPYINNSNRSGVIDFINVPCQLGQPYEDPYHPSIYAQAGFPGYQPYNNPSQLGAAVYPVAASAYLPYDNSVHTNSVSSSMPPVESEAVLHQRINDKIDAIIQAQKENVLNSKIDSLSTKVEQISNNLSSKSTLSSENNSHLSDAAQIHILTNKVEQLSQSLEIAQMAHGNNTINSLNNSRTMQSPYSPSFPPHPSDLPVHISSEPSDQEISRRLRRLAAESSMRAGGNGRDDSAYRIPDW